MEIGWTILGTVIAIAAIVIPINYAKRAEKKKSKEKRDHLLLLFNSSKTIALDMRGKLLSMQAAGKYTDGSIVVQGMNLPAAISAIEFALEKYLSDELAKNIRTIEISDTSVDSLSRDLETQLQNLRVWNTEVDLKLRQNSR